MDRRWEYLVVHVGRSGERYWWIDSQGHYGVLQRHRVPIPVSEGRPRVGLSEQIQLVELPAFAELLNDLGRQGWEIAGVSPAPEISGDQWLLKRPAPA